MSVKEPHFKVFPEFRNSSYAKRYELFCRRLVLERHYDSTAFLMSNAEKSANGDFSEPANDLTFQLFANSLAAHIAAFSGRIKQL
ncbi:MAG: PaeR7I family type II restriction endonuclease [Limisphaerales bacterium]